jgi:uncharacterized protein YdeI (YjbR/CyaY-like superfamily)
MGKRDKRVDAYIAKSAEFARPILETIREAVHEGCPDVEETIKWSFPHFDYKGILCGMAAFKEHCALGFWKGSMIVEGKANQSADAMGQFGRITSPKDLPSRKSLVSYVREAAELNEKGIKKPSAPRPKGEKKLMVPDFFLSAVKQNKKALATFNGFPYSKKKDYVEWVTEAKTDATRQRRLETSVAWLSEGKSRNWKYERC